jgi:hypothetical protein
MNYPHQQTERGSGQAIRINFKGVTPECFNRGSSSDLAWISAEGRIRPKPCGGPAKSMRE